MEPAAVRRSKPLKRAYRTTTTRRPAGGFGAVGADCEIVTGRPAIVIVPDREDDVEFVETR
jgi:hypothetical protein